MRRRILAVTFAGALFGVVASPAVAQNSESAPVAAAPMKSKPKTPAGGTVTVSASETPQGPELRVADSGPGIPSEERSRVTERFVRLEASRNSPGTGLGLSLVAAVARLHDARLMLDDNKPGLAASIRFPRATLRPR